MVETIMEHAAYTVGKDPFDVRMENIADDEMKKLFTEFATSVGKN
jgi:xanthine dehydrogenase molybdopterin-binding subunit B